MIENRPGANGSVAIGAMLSAPADGYSFVVSDGSILSINPVIYSKLSYNTAEVVPAVMLGRAPLFLAVHPKVPIKSMKELIDYAKARPGELNYGSSGVGSTHHLSMEAINAALNIKMTHVPFKGTGESVPALLGGHVDLLFSAYPSLSGAIESKKVTLLANNGPGRSAQAPDAPPVADTIPGFDFAPVIGLPGKKFDCGFCWTPNWSLPLPTGVDHLSESFEPLPDRNCLACSSRSNFGTAY